MQGFLPTGGTGKILRNCTDITTRICITNARNVYRESCDRIQYKPSCDITNNYQSNMQSRETDGQRTTMQSDNISSTSGRISRFTRPDISITVSLLGRMVEDPSQRNLEAARRVLQYLWSTKSVKHILAKTSAKVDAEIWVDASYGGEGSRSQTGALVTVAEQPINWYSRRQDVVALSVTRQNTLQHANEPKMQHGFDKYSRN
jgi:hypothetical protein